MKVDDSLQKEEVDSIVDELRSFVGGMREAWLLKVRQV
jgi:hypothetical protein